MKNIRGARVVAILTLTALVPLGTFALVVAADDFPVTTATYLGGREEGEQHSAVDFAPDGTLVLAGTSAGWSPKDVKTSELLGGGYGFVARLAGDGKQVLSLTRLGDWIEDMEVDAVGRIAVCGSFGVAVLKPEGGGLVWRDGDVLRGTQAAQFRNQTPPFKHPRYTRRVARVAVGREDGVVASIQMEEKTHGAGPKQGRLYIWDAEGKRLADVQLTGCKYLEDVCVCPREKLVIVGGWNTYAADSPHMKNHPIHMPWLAAFDYAGKQKWLSYDFTAAACYKQNFYADSRVQRLVIGRDGKLYMGGYIHGGDYVWALDPHDVTKRVKRDTGYDSFSVAANMGRGIDQSYFAEFDVKTGDMLRGQVLLCRQTEKGGGKPTQIQIKGLHADEQGNVYLSGYCEKYIKDRDSKSIGGEAVGAYYKPEPFLLVVTPDFRKRLVWTVFSKHCEAASWGLSVFKGRAALSAEVYEGELITTTDAMQPTPPGPRCGYLATFPALAGD